MWLSIDQGGHASRALVFDAGGEVVARAEVPIATHRDGLRVEHDAAALLDSVERSVDAVAAELGTRLGALEAAGIATQRSSLVCASRSSGRALTPVLSWQDRRGLEDMAAFAPEAERIRTITGLQLSPHYGVAKLRWCLAHDRATRRALAAGDLVMAPLVTLLTHALGGDDTWRIDPANASRTLLMDLATGDWSSELVGLFGIPAGVLPQMSASRDAYGSIRCGSRQVPLVVATGDQPAALFAAGAPAPGTALVNMGTGAFIQAVTGVAPVTDRALLTSIAWDAPPERLYVLEGTVNGAGAALDAMLAPLGFDALPEPSALAAALAALEGAPLFLNGVAGLGSPDWRPDFRSRFVGDGAPMQKLAAVLESVVFLVARNLERMRARIELDRIVLAGGLARFDWMAQTLATLAQLPVYRLEEAEATARGLAFLVSRGRLPGATLASCFEPSRVTRSRERYARWSDVLEAALTG